MTSCTSPADLLKSKLCSLTNETPPALICSSNLGRREARARQLATSLRFKDNAGNDQPLMEHQLEGLARGILRPRVGFGYDPGLGKTAMLLAIITAWAEDCPKWLVFAPISVMNTAWLKDAKAYFPWLRVKGLWSRRGRDVVKNIERNDWDVGVINHDSARIHLQALKNCGFTGLVLDESSKFANPKTQRTLAMLELAKQAQVCYALSGLANPNDDSQFFSQLQIVSGNRAFLMSGNRPMSFSFFLNTYFFQRSVVLVTGPRAGKQQKIGRPVLLKRRRDEFYREVGKWWIVKRKQDCLDLPEKVPEIYNFDLNREEMNAYVDMLENLRLELGGKPISATGMSQLMKLRQITGGFVIDNEGKFRMLTGKPSKMTLLMDLLDGPLAGRKVVLWGTFRREIEMLSRWFDGAPIIYGGMTPAQREEAMRRFIEDDQCRILCANPKAAGHGVDGLQRVCTDAVFFSLDWSYDDHNQGIDRLHRIGQDGKVTLHYLISPDTVDEKLYDSLVNKYSAAEFAKSVLRV